MIHFFWKILNYILFFSIELYLLYDLVAFSIFNYYIFIKYFHKLMYTELFVSFGNKLKSVY